MIQKPKSNVRKDVWELVKNRWNPSRHRFKNPYKLCEESIRKPKRGTT
jgi:hypothetical protein